jgi:Tfp pilus assembly protein PilF
MRRAWLTTMVATAVLLSGLLGQARAAPTNEPDPGAGAILMQITPCLIALRSGEGERCPEPLLPDGGADNVRVAAHLARAKFFIDMQNLSKAVAEVDAALALDPADVKARHLSARLAYTTQNFPRAESEIAIALQQASDDPDVQATYAVIVEARPAPVEALRQLEAIIARHPDHAYSRLQRARMLVDCCRAREALDDLDFLVEHGPLTLAVLGLRARANRDVGLPQAAADDYSAALAIDPQRFDLLMGRAEAYAAGGLDAAALRDYDAILGPPGGRPRYAIGGDQYGKLLMERALVLVRVKRFADGVTDMTTSVLAGGTPSVLRAQVFLRQNGFPDVPLDGHDSAALRNALGACFGRDACFHGLLRRI